VLICNVDNLKVTQTMRDVVDGTIELVLRDNAKTCPTPGSTPPEISPKNDDMPVGFSLIYVEKEFGISEKNS